MKSYLWGTFWAFLISLFTTTVWYLIFGYVKIGDLSREFVTIYSSLSFWIGVGIWAVLYYIFFIFPIIFIRRSPQEKLTNG